MKKIFSLLVACGLYMISYGQNYYPSTGNVGLGTNSPGALLHVNEGFIKLDRTTSKYVSNFDDIKGILMQGLSFDSELAIGYSAIGGGAAAVGFGRVVAGILLSHSTQTLIAILVPTTCWSECVLIQTAT